MFVFKVVKHINQLHIIRPSNLIMQLNNGNNYKDA